MTTAYETLVLGDSPALYWPLDESLGATVATDISGNGLDGTYGSDMAGGTGIVAGSTVSASGDYADATNAYVTRPGHDAVLDVGTGDFTMEFWCQQNATPAFGNAVSRLDSGLGTGALCYDGFGTTGSPEFNAIGPSFTSVTTAVPVIDGNIHHIVMVRSSALLYMYVDGAADGAPVASTDDIEGGLGPVFQVGIPAFGSAFDWDSPIAHVAWYTHALSPTAIAAHYATGSAGVSGLTLHGAGFVDEAFGTGSLIFQTILAPTGFVDEALGFDYVNPTAYEVEVIADGPSLWWKLDEASGTSAFDFSGHGLAGTYGSGMGVGGAAGIVTGTSAAPNPTGRTNAYVTRLFTDAELLVGTGDFTIERWILPMDPSSGGWPGSAGNNHTGLTASGGNIGAYTSDGFSHFVSGVPTQGPTQVAIAEGFTGDGVVGNVNIRDGNVHHIVTTRIGGILALYVDGVTDGTPTVPGSFDLDLSSPIFGAGGPTGPPYSFSTSFNLDGPINHVAWYKHGLSGARVAAHYLAGGGTGTITDGVSFLDETFGTGTISFDVPEFLARQFVDEKFGTPSLTRSVYEATVMADGPSIYWPLSEASGTIAQDISGSGLDGAYGFTMHPGGPTLVIGSNYATDPSTKTGASVTRPIDDTAIQVGTGDFSMEVWFKPGPEEANFGTTAAANEFGAIATNATGALISVAAATGLITVLLDSFSAFVQQTGSVNVRDGNTHHVVVTRDAGMVQLYVDGAADGSAFSDLYFGTPVDISTGDDLRFRLGFSADEGGSDNGNFDGPAAHAAWYTHALTSTRVLAHYEAGISLTLEGEGWLDEAFGRGTMDVSGTYLLTGVGWLDEAFGTFSYTDTIAFGTRVRGGLATPSAVVDASALGHRTRSGFAFPSFITGGGGGGDTAIITQRWKLVDPLTSEVYSFDMNPNAGALPQYGRQIFTSQTTAVDGQGLVYEGEKVLATVAATGVLLERTQYDSLVAWVAKPYPVYLTDDNGVQSVIYLTKFTPTRAPLRSHPYRHTYELDYLLLESL